MDGRGQNVVVSGIVMVRRKLNPAMNSTVNFVGVFVCSCEIVRNCSILLIISDSMWFWDRLIRSWRLEKIESRQ